MREAEEDRNERERGETNANESTQHAYDACLCFN